MSGRREGGKGRVGEEMRRKEAREWQGERGVTYQSSVIISPRGILLEW